MLGFNRQLLFLWITCGCWSSQTLAFLPAAHQTSTRLNSVLLRLATNSPPSVVVISPPGGVGQEAAVQAANLGGQVRWFLVADDTNIVLSPAALEQVQAAGGSVQVAGATPQSLLQDSEARMAVSKWCGTAQAIICTMDGVVKDNENTKKAIKIAAQQASKAFSGTKIVVLPPNDDGETEDEGNNKLFGIFGKAEIIPETLAQAMGASEQEIVALRHGQLFGLPQSSPDFSPLVGGPRKDYELCQEYQMRQIRVDPTITVTGNMMMGANTKSSRQAVGRAAALVALNRVPVRPGLDVCVTSLPGTDPVDEEGWNRQFRRVVEADSGEATLITTDFGGVPNVERLTDWLATKWAPAVLRTYDLASIRVGARPVYAVKSGPSQVEIVWQQLVNYDAVKVGTMVIQVSENGLVATRGPGDASKGFSTVSRKPLAGEDILVRQLLEAAAQAVEKGLAQKALVAPQPVVVPPPPVTEPVVAPPVVAPPVEAASSASGPRTAGARRSRERARGGNSSRSNDTAPDDDEKDESSNNKLP